MRFCLLSLTFIFFSQLGFSQTSLSAGMNFRLESPTKMRYENEKSISPFRPYYVISLDRQTKNWMFNYDLMWLHCSSNISQYVPNGPFTEGMPFSSTTKIYKSNIAYSYVGFKLGADRIFKLGNNSIILIGLFAQTDYLTKEKESNHQINENTIYYGWALNPQTYQYESHPTTVEKTKTNVFDAATMRNTLFCSGIQLKPRFTFKHLFTELNFSAGFTQRRISYNIAENPSCYRIVFAEAGLKIGYTFR